MESKLKLVGKRSTIVLDADAGGIWISARHSPSVPCLSLYLDQRTEQPAVGLYHDGDITHGCAAALSIDSDGCAILQTHDQRGDAKLINLTDLVSLLESHPSATDRDQDRSLAPA